jgi:hypothetical protein
MNPSTDPNERIKLHEAVGAAAILVFVAVSLTVAYTGLAPDAAWWV